jgi:hypothetical protein
MIHTASFDAAFIKATDAAHLPADKIAGVKDLTVEKSTAMADTTYIGDQNASSVPGATTTSFSMSGHVNGGDAPQDALRTGLTSKAIVYLTVINDAEATAGSQGFRYPVYVESYNEKFAQGDVIAFDAKFALARGTITAV